MSLNALGVLLKNLEIFNSAKEVGFDYILNPSSGELHSTSVDFFGSHNLVFADLEGFIGLTNVGLIKATFLPDGTLLPVFDIITGKLIGEYKLNKCRHCFK